MTNDRGKHLHMEFALRTRDAASRFAPRRTKAATSRRVWRPLILQWRRRQKRILPRSVIRRVTLSTSYFSFPGFQFYFAQHGINRGRWFARSEITSANRETQAPVDRAHSAAPNKARAEGASLMFRQCAISIRERAELRKRSNGVAPVSMHVAATQKNYTAPARFADLERRYFTAPAPSIRPFRQRRDLSLPLNARTLPTSRDSRDFMRTRSQPFSGAVALVAPRSRTRDRSASPVTVEKIANRGFRNEELVWRRKTQTLTEADEQVRRFQSFDPMREELQSSSSPIQQQLIELKQAVESSSAKPITKLDPSLVDRLADDVIRKVEKRVRIERERRGI